MFVSLVVPHLKANTGSRALTVVADLEGFMSSHNVVPKTDSV